MRINPKWIMVCGILLLLPVTAWSQQPQHFHPYGFAPGGQWPPRAEPAPPPAPATPVPATPAPAVAEPPAPPAAVAVERPVATPSASPATPLPGGMQWVPSRLGEVLADANGRTLYLFDQEQAGVPLCSGACALRWPPLLIDGNSSLAPPFFPLQREDGSRQWSWNGRPLYRWFGDSEAGDVTGDGINGVWHAVRR